MADYTCDEEFRRAWEKWYEYSVRRAVEETYRRAAWRSETEGYAMLAAALDSRGVPPDPQAVRAGAALITRGRRPAVLRRSDGPAVAG
jgi:hypothetical protein